MADLDAAYNTKVAELKDLVASLEKKRDALVADVKARKDLVMSL
jgi:hypothetical protein